MTLDSPSARLIWAREHHGKYPTPTEAARAFGWKTSTYLGHENGDRTPSRPTAKRYAKAYRVRWEWLLEGEGAATGGAQTVPVVGIIGRDNVTKLLRDKSTLDVVESPPGGGASTVALRVDGPGSMRGVADDGWLIFFDDDRRPPTKDLLNKLCVVELENGDVLVRTLCPGHRRGRFDLEFPTEPTLRDQRVAWAARVTWMKPR